MRMPRLALFSSLLLALACATGPDPSESVLDDGGVKPRDDAPGRVAERAALEAARFEHIAQLVLPDAAEDAWRQVAWIPAYAEAVLAAERQDKPLLMWAMNGHPLGCT